MPTSKTKGDVYPELVKINSKLDEHNNKLVKLNTKVSAQSVELVNLNAKINGQIAEFVKLNAQVHEQNEKFVTKEDNQRVLNLVDSVLGEVKAMRQEQAAHFQQHEDTKNILKNHERRIKKLEASTASA